MALLSRFHVGARFPFLRRCYFWLIARLKPSRLEINGMWMQVHPHDNAVTHSLLNFGTYEPFETALLSGLLRPGDVFVDIGANIGYYTLLAARVVGPAGRVVALEPGRENLRLLCANVASNSFTNVNVLAVAAGAQAGTLPLFESPTNMGDHRLYAVDQRDHYDVEVVTLDDQLEQMALVPSVVKIDIQGYEYQAMSGLARTLAAVDRCVVCSEFWSDGLRSGGCADPSRYLAFFIDLGFELYDIDEDGATLRPLAGDTLAAFASADRETNILAVKGIKRAGLLAAIPSLVIATS